jgi:hypothetical protein
MATRGRTTSPSSFAFLFLAFVAATGLAQKSPDPSKWTLYITNDACSDYTWGFDEAQTRRAFADTLRSHLDEMRVTDKESPDNQDRYNLSVMQELDAFVEYYPARKAELLQRIREGRVAVSPVYNNALWGFQSTEAMLRTFYPARRLEREWNLRFDWVEHIEEPALPWGAASVLAASGFRWLTAPYYDYDSTFSGLKNPPLFLWEGRDGGSVRVAMDHFASAKAHYLQGKYLLSKPERITSDWLPHYQNLDGYPVSVMLASGTHSDNGPQIQAQTPGIAEAIIRYNAQPGPHPRLVNATLPMYLDAVDAAKPVLPVLRGDFGHSWDAWPVTLASYAAAGREGERNLLAAESLMAVAPPAAAKTNAELYRKAEWNWIMMGDHAWNGTDDANRKVNADLRQRWSSQLNAQALEMTQNAWRALDLKPDASHLTLFNSLSFARQDLVRLTQAGGSMQVLANGKTLPSQTVIEDGQPVIYFVSPEVPSYGFVELTLAPAALQPQMVAGNFGNVLGTADANPETVYFDGAPHRVEGAISTLESVGPVLKRIRVQGHIGAIDITTFVTTYPALDRTDVDVRIHKPASTREERITQSFPVLTPGAELHVDTMGVVIKPHPQPEGDLLPGADQRRFAVQGFVDAVTPDGRGITIAPLDSFLLRKDLGGITFEALGSDQNFKESSRDQGGVTEFRFRYALTHYTGGYSNGNAVKCSRAAATPLLVARGRIAKQSLRPSVDSGRAIALAYKPAEEGGSLLRIWETAGLTGPLDLPVTGYKQAFLTDLLERNIQPLPIKNGRVHVDLKANGFAAVRLVQ